MNKKHYSKRKKVVIDALDGKIINEPKALKLSNIEEYLEKNGFKMVKIFSVLLIMCIMSFNVYAFNPKDAVKYDLSSTPNVHLLLFISAFAILLIVLGYTNDNFLLLVLGCITLFFIGIILLANSFNPVLSILVIIIPLILIWMGD